MNKTKIGFSVVLIICLAVCQSTVLMADTAYPNPLEIEEIKSFLGRDGFGSRHPKAPEALEAFGQLAGIWDASVKMQALDGTMRDGPPGLWVWRYDLDGFVVRDLFFHSQEHLPSYLFGMDRPYLLTAMRSFNPRAGQWEVAWSANSISSSPADSSGAFTATQEGENIVMLDDSPFGMQRVTFSDISSEQFRWSSEYSQDQGKTWVLVMEVVAHKRHLE